MPAIRARMTVTNFHSFCQRVLHRVRGRSRPAAPPRRPRRHRQVLLLRTSGRTCRSSTTTDWGLGEFVEFINRAKDELVTPADFDAFVADGARRLRGPIRQLRRRRRRLEAQGNLRAAREVRRRYARLRAKRAGRGRGRGRDVQDRSRREDRRPRSPPARWRHGRATGSERFAPEHHAQIDGSRTPTSGWRRARGPALRELALVYRAYQEDSRGAARSTSVSRSLP